jgi:hypothetical protein
MQTLQRPEQPCKHVFVKTRDGELACKFCGEVKQSFNMIPQLPMDVTYQPSSSICFGKALGNTLNYYGLLRVLAKGPGGRSDLGIRARQIKLITMQTEPPQLHKSLNIASAKLILLGFEENHVVSNDCGNLLRKLFAFLMLSKMKFQTQELADAALYYTLKKHGYEPNPPPKFEAGWIKTNVLKFREKFLRLCRLLDAQTRDFFPRLKV